MKKDVLIIMEHNLTQLRQVSENGVPNGATLGSRLTRAQLVERYGDVPDGCMRVVGVIGIADIVNDNGRVYEYSEYKKHIDLMHERCISEGVFGELEHPKTMALDWERMTHKVEDVWMNENGVAEGCFLLMNEGYGKIAQFIAKSGSPIKVSSRGRGYITEDNKVILEQMKTFDVISDDTGFRQARMYDIGEGKTLKPISEEKFSLVNESNVSSNSEMCVTVYDYKEVEAYEKAVKANEQHTKIDEDQLSKIVETAISKHSINTNENANKKNDDINEAKIVSNVLESVSKVFEDRLGIVEKAMNIRIVEACKATAVSLENAINEELANIEGGSNADAVSKTLLLETILPSMVEGIEDYLINTFKPEITTERNEFVTGVYSEGLINGLDKWLTNEWLVNVSDGIEKYIDEDVITPLKLVSSDAIKANNEVIVSGLSEGIEKHLSSEYNGHILDVVESYLKTGKRSGAINESSTSNLPVDLNNGNVVLNAIDEALKIAETAEKTKPVKTDESKIPVYFKFMPENLKNVFASLTNENKNKFIRQANSRVLESQSDVVAFWKGRNIVEALHNQSGSNRTGSKTGNANNDLNESYSSRFSAAYRERLTNMCNK